LPKSSTAWVGCTNVTDDRQTTDGRLIAYSKRNVIRWRLLKTWDYAVTAMGHLPNYQGCLNTCYTQEVDSVNCDNSVLRTTQVFFRLILRLTALSSEYSRFMSATSQLPTYQDRTKNYVSPRYRSRHRQPTQWYAVGRHFWRPTM